MSHQICELDGAVYAREPAWHGIGVVLPDNFTAKEALHYAKLDWKVELEPCQYNIYNENGDLENIIKVPNYNWTVRTDLPKTDPRRILGCVGPRYTVIQNNEAFKMADAILNESGAHYESAFSMRNGKRVAMLLKLPEKINIKDDTLEKYLCVRTGHDGIVALEAMLTSVRVVCNNTLNMAIRGAKNRAKIRHVKNASAQIMEVQRILGLANEYFDKQAQVFESLAQKQVNSNFVKAYIEALFPVQKQQHFTRTHNIRARILHLFEGGQAGASMQAIRGTRWGLFNAVSEYADHIRTVRAQGRTKEEARADSVLYGTTLSLKQRALNLLLNADNLLSNALVCN